MPEPQKKPSILFVCTGNTARSQMAEGLMRQHFGDCFDVHSAGIYPGIKLDAAIAAMDEVGIDITTQEVTSVQTYYAGNVTFDYVITVCANAAQQCPAFPSAKQTVNWDFPDPAAEKTYDARLEVARLARNQILTSLRSWVATLPRAECTKNGLQGLLSWASSLLHGSGKPSRT